MRSNAAAPIADLRTVEFRRSFRGYDVHVVDDYLEELAVSLEREPTSSTSPEPDAIARQVFPTSLRGYNTKEVGTYLKSVADELRNSPIR